MPVSEAVREAGTARTRANEALNDPLTAAIPGA